MQALAIIARNWQETGKKLARNWQETGKKLEQIYLRVTVRMLEADGDGMSDLWEQGHFGSSGNTVHGADADGMVNVGDVVVLQRCIMAAH